jgi:hypothetical protein
VSRIVTIIAAVVLIVHGLIHLLGTALYARHAEIKGLSYKTTLFGGRWDFGERGIRVFGGLWVLPAVGFVASGLALLAGWGWWKPVLVGVTLISLVLTGIDWSNALTGAIVDIAILILLWLGPRMAGWPF